MCVFAIFSVNCYNEINNNVTHIYSNLCSLANYTTTTTTKTTQSQKIVPTGGGIALVSIWHCLIFSARLPIPSAENSQHENDHDDNNNRYNYK